MQIPALKLPKFNPALALLSNAIRVCALPNDIAFGTGVLTLSVNRGTSIFNPVCLVTLSVNGTQWRFALSDVNWLAMHPVFVEARESAQNFESLPNELKTALAETLFAPLLEKLSKTLGTAVLFEDASFNPISYPSSETLNLTAITSSDLTGGSVTQIAVTLPNKVAVESLSSILASAPKIPYNNFFNALPVRLSFRVGTMTLSKEEVNGIATGDVLVPEKWLPTLKKVMIRAGAKGLPSLEAECALEESTATLTSLFHSVEETAMSEVDDLPINLSFELENRTVTLGELKTITEGYVFTLASNPTAPVTVCANGKAIAKGTLVDLNGVIGVQISEVIK